MGAQSHRRPGRRVTMMIDGSGSRRTLAAEIVRVARASGLTAVGVFRGVDGFTPGTGLYGWPPGPPTMIIVTGDPESIDDFVEGVAPVLDPGELTVEDVAEIVRADTISTRRTS